jgi:cation diffusion facilitator CzcD-associated flavoprotein CzcO
MTELDVLIVGAGISGIDAAYHLKTQCPELSFAVLEGRDAIGGTWDLFRYPGVRSDSDMFTLGFPFNPWRGENAISDAGSILQYLRDTATRFGIDAMIRFKHRVVAARWSSDDARWTLDVEVGPEKRHEQLRCRFLYLCSGYYAYDQAHAPVFPGAERFKGRVIHPQWWPQDFDYSGKRVVVIGSGATAVTLVPAMSERAAHVTMLQRSPTWIASMPARDAVADVFRRLLPAGLAHRLARAKNVALTLAFYLFCRHWPQLAARLLLREMKRRLPKGYPVEQHFVPRYGPWQQRLCLVPDDDLFKAIATGKASVVTDTIESFDETGIALSSGTHLDADAIVTATGLKLLPIGGLELSVDGQQVQIRDTLVYKGVMLSGVPNFAWCVGYTNASWTLRADISSRYVCRLLRYMHMHGLDIAVPNPEAAGPQRRPLLNLTSGYVTRAASDLPQQGEKAPWFLRQNYVLDLLSNMFGGVDDAAMSFSRLAQTPRLEAENAVARVQ